MSPQRACRGPTGGIAFVASGHDGGKPPPAPAAQGGTGKTQLAVAFTHALWGARAVDALVWVSATSREAIITGFAQAAPSRSARPRRRCPPRPPRTALSAGWHTPGARGRLILDDLYLISVDPASSARTVRMHASVQAAVRAYLPPADLEQAVLAAAEALTQTWPETGGESQGLLEQAQLEQVLRDCTGAPWAADSAIPSPAEGGQHARPAPPGSGGLRDEIRLKPETGV